MKVCIVCGVKKPFEEFYKREKGSLDGYRNDCKKCMSARGKSNYQKNKEYVKTKTKEWYYNNPDKVKNQRLQYAFGISLNEYNALLKAQNNKCAICETDQNSSGKYFAVDHNHSTGEVRGLLCTKCNTALGQFNDSPEILDKAKAYLQFKGHYGPDTTTSP